MASEVDELRNLLVRVLGAFGDPSLAGGARQLGALDAVARVRRRPTPWLAAVFLHELGEEQRPRATEQIRAAYDAGYKAGRSN